MTLNDFTDAHSDIPSVPDRLREFFTVHPRLALAFSGGTDSAYLLYAAIACGCTVRAYYVTTPFQPQFELEDARRLADELNAPMTILPLNVLTIPKIRENPADRCYHCKHAIFQSIISAAKRDGFTELMDGTNASDDAGDRPGMRALFELSVLSPLRLCGVTKEALRTYSRYAGLFTWNKPAYACLATRIPTDIPLLPEVLEMIEWAEEELSKMGFSDFRVRVMPTKSVPETLWDAKLQITAAGVPLLMERRQDVYMLLKKKFNDVLLDLKIREPSV